jgi:hypothetical protein
MEKWLSFRISVYLNVPCSCHNISHPHVVVYPQNVEVALTSGFYFQLFESEILPRILVVGEQRLGICSDSLLGS